MESFEQKARHDLIYVWKDSTGYCFSNRGTSRIRKTIYEAVAVIQARDNSVQSRAVWVEKPIGFSKRLDVGGKNLRDIGLLFRLCSNWSENVV